MSLAPREGKLLLSIWKRFHVPILILGVCLIAFGLQVLWLGYYIDDWIILNVYNSWGFEGLRLYAFYDSRPLIFWIWWIGFQVNGLTPALWQIWTLFWRFLAAVGFWLLLRGIWPEYKRQALMATLLFSVYPIFLQQSTALTYSFHWVCLFLLFISLYFMVLSILRPGRFWLYTLLSLVTAAIQLFSQEFYVGLELLRPILIGYLLAGSLPKLKDRLRKVTVVWLPYAVMLVIYFMWRFLLMPTPGTDRNAPGMLQALLRSPSTILQFLQTALQDMFNGIVATWSKTFTPDVLFSFSPISSLMALGLVILTSFGLFVILYRILRIQEDEGITIPSNWYRSGLLLGLMAMLFGFAPAWAIGRSFTSESGLFNDRFGLAAMAGAALVVTALIDWIIQNHKYQLAIYCLLIGLAVGLQFRTQNSYRWSWEKQIRTYWELKWRAPQVEGPTAFFAESTLFNYMGGAANAAAFNQLYAFDQHTPLTQYWYFDLFKTDPGPIIRGEAPIYAEKGGMKFIGAKDQNLVIQSYPELGQCVWVLSLTDYYNPSLSGKVKETLQLSNLNRIKDGDSTLPASIFGPQPAPFWCYYYEKASLAAQFGRWDEVIRLWKEADSQRFHPSVEQEYLPFVEAAAMSGDWQLARDLGLRAYHPRGQMNDYLCTVWQRVFENAPASEGRDDTLKWVKGEFNCSAFFK